MKKLMVIDGNSIMNRAFYGLQGSRMMKTADGLFTNALFGFLNIFFKFMDEEKPTHVAVAFDLKAPTFRHKAFEGYKAHRSGMPEELVMQMPAIKELLDAMAVTRIELEGYEADDILGTCAILASNAGAETVIVTGDRDSFQLVSETTSVRLPVTRGGKTEVEFVDLSAIEEKYGLKPSQMIDVKALMGDASDNIPGVAGVGEKTALGLIQTYGTLDNVYASLESVSKTGVRQKLADGRESAYQSRWLATICTEVPLAIGFEDMECREPDPNTIQAMLSRLEFRSFVNRFKAADTETVREEVSYVNMNDLMALSSWVKAQKVIALAWQEHEGLPDRLMMSNGTEQVFAGTISSWTFLKEFLNQPGNLLAGHDIKTVFRALAWQGVASVCKIFDTAVADYILDPQEDNMDFTRLAARIAGISVSSCRNETESKPEILAGEAKAVFDMISVYMAKLAERDQTLLAEAIEWPLIRTLAEMEAHGFKADPQGLQELSAEFSERLTSLESSIHFHAGETFNINSTKQLGVILFEKLGLRVVKKTKTGYSTDSEVLEELRGEHEIIELIVEYRMLSKLKSTYAEGLQTMINPETGKIHSKFNQTVAATGRLSSTDPNLQNIPVRTEMGRRIRKVFIPESPEWVLVDADYSQIELRILAEITKDPTMTEAFNTGADIHTQTAARVFGVDEQQVTSLMRSQAKAVNFGILYGIGDFSLAKDLGISRKKAKEYIDEYLNHFPAVRQYMEDIKETARQQGYVSTLFGRRRYIPELSNKNFAIRSFGERVALNAPIQGTAADIIKIAMLRVDRALKEKNLRSRMILQVHDELIIETYRPETDQVCQLLKDAMEQAVDTGVPMSVEVKTGESWYETK